MQKKNYLISYFKMIFIRDKTKMITMILNKENYLILIKKKDLIA